MFGEAHYPVALVYLSLSLGPDGTGRGRHKEISPLCSFAQLSCLFNFVHAQPYFFSTLELIVDLGPSLLFAPHPSFHPFIPPRLKIGGGGGMKGCTGLGSLALRGPGSTIKYMCAGLAFHFLLVLSPHKPAPSFFDFIFPARFMPVTNNKHTIERYCPFFGLPKQCCCSLAPTTLLFSVLVISCHKTHHERSSRLPSIERSKPARHRTQRWLHSPISFTIAEIGSLPFPFRRVGKQSQCGDAECPFSVLAYICP